MSLFLLFEIFRKEADYHGFSNFYTIKMSFEEFLNSIETGHVPENIRLKALYYDALGNWELAHDLINEFSGKDADRIHAYLHRKEGDLWNARYWYHRIGMEVPDHSLDEEWENLVRQFLH
ncbi:MAG: hypothetical protein KDC49_14910 [Saprospiraceae bacterium]|nr:hypothetical protein [Saprospiraceae bacterium]